MTSQQVTEQVVKRCWAVGADCGEQRHRLVMLNEHCERMTSLWVRNDPSEIREALLKLLLMLPPGANLEIVTEGVRSLGGALTQVAISMGILICQVNPKALESYRVLEGQPRKDDDRDAFLLAKMRINDMEGCRVAVDASPEERMLSRLSRLHTQLTEDRKVTMGRLRSRLLELSPEVLGKEWQGPSYDSKGMRAVLQRWPGFDGLERARISTVERVLRASTKRGSNCQGMAKALKDMAGNIALCPEERGVVKMELAILIDQTATAEAALADVDARMRAEVERHPIGRKLLEMPGEGHFSAAVDVGEILPLVRNVPEGKAATYAGITPLSRRSGKGGGPSKLARGVNKHALRAQYLGAVSARRVSAIDDAYYNKQLERHQGHPKPHVKANLALARQRFKVKYKLMTTDDHYDKETLIASHLDRQRRAREQAGVADSSRSARSAARA